MAARAAAAVALLVTLSLLAVATAQCIECKDCGNSNTCLSTCKRECPKPPPPSINIEACKKYGEAAGRDSASFACGLTMKYCQQQKNPRSVGYSPPARVTLAQCGNAAFGVCQSWTRDASKAPCGSNFNGVGPCSKKEFMDFYTGVADEQCNQKSAPFDKPQGRR